MKYTCLHYFDCKAPPSSHSFPPPPPPFGTGSDLRGLEVPVLLFFRAILRLAQPNRELLYLFHVLFAVSLSLCDAHIQRFVKRQQCRGRDPHDTKARRGAESQAPLPVSGRNRLTGGSWLRPTPSAEDIPPSSSLNITRASRTGLHITRAYSMVWHGARN